MDLWQSTQRVIGPQAGFRMQITRQPREH